MDDRQKKAYLKKAFWDTNCKADDLLLILYKKNTQIADITLERLYLRLLESYSWHRLVDIVPKEQLQEMLSGDIIEKLRSEKLRNRYINVAALLRREALSSAG